MSTEHVKYCLDANVLIESWQKYYSPKLCPDYWVLLDELGKKNMIFIPDMVFQEITRTEDELTDWLKNSGIPVYKIDEPVTLCLKKVYENPVHRQRVDNVKKRSLADPWVIAHALNENACVVTKEERVTAANTNKIKIPNVCENLGIRSINDFQFLLEVNVRFSCAIK